MTTHQSSSNPSWSFDGFNANSDGNLMGWIDQTISDFSMKGSVDQIYGNLALGGHSRFHWGNVPRGVDNLYPKSIDNLKALGRGDN